VSVINPPARGSVTMTLGKGRN